MGVVVAAACARPGVKGDDEGSSLAITPTTLGNSTYLAIGRVRLVYHAFLNSKHPSFARVYVYGIDSLLRLYRYARGILYNICFIIYHHDASIQQ